MLRLAAYKPDGSIDPAAITQAGELLRQGRLVALPTETVYGLGAHALDPDAVRSVFAAKGRPSYNPLIVHVLDEAHARRLASRWPKMAHFLAQAFWPGPLTLVVPRASEVPDVVTGGIDSVALRVPSHPVMRAVLETSGLPIAAPSANPFGSVSPTRAEHVMRGLEGRIDAVLDAGTCDVGIESTVVDLTGDVPRLLRPGGVPASELERVIGPLEDRQIVLDSGQRSSPGLLSRHYAPSGQTSLVPSSELLTRLAGMPQDARVGAITRLLDAPTDPRVASWHRLGDDPATFARSLYDALHRIDEAGCTHVLLERVPATPEWSAVLDRLTRAAGSPHP